MTGFLPVTLRAIRKKRGCSKSLPAILVSHYSGHPALHPCGASLRLFKIDPVNFVGQISSPKTCCFTLVAGFVPYRVTALHEIASLRSQ